MGSPYERLREFKVVLFFHLLHINFSFDTSKLKSFEIQMKLSKNLCLKNCSSAIFRVMISDYVAYLRTALFRLSKCSEGGGDLIVTWWLPPGMNCTCSSPLYLDPPPPARARFFKSAIICWCWNHKFANYISSRCKSYSDYNLIENCF